MRIYFAIALALASIAMIVTIIFLDAAPKTASKPLPASQVRDWETETPAEEPTENASRGESNAETSLIVDSTAVSPSLGGQLGADDATKTADEIRATVRNTSNPVLGAPASNSASIDSRQRDQDFIRAVTVEVQNNSANAVGSGVVIAVGARMVDVLTADHVLDAPASDKNPLKLAVRWNSREGEQGDSIIGLASLSQPLYQAVRVLKRDPASDLAVIRVEMPGGTETVQAASLHPGGVDSLVSLVGEPAWTFATNGRSGQQNTPVSLTKIEGMEIARTSESAAANAYLRVDVPSELGMSGGGLFLPSKGNRPPRLIGIASGNSNQQGYYVAAHEISDLMRRIRASGI